MRKRFIVTIMHCIFIFSTLVIALSFCGCNTAKNMIGTKHGVAYFNKPRNTPEIIYTNIMETQGEEAKIEDASFLDKLIAAIDGKPASNDFCNCLGDYQITIDNKYTFRLHTDKIVIITNAKEFTGFTVECSEAEMTELYAIIESIN